jgi:predicted RNA-binding Zn ribbon-like protein
MSSWIDRSMPWLGVFPIAVELANTVVITGSGAVDLMATDEELDTWIQAETARFPIAEVARGHLPEVRALREDVRALLFATVEGRPLPNAPRVSINRMSSRSPRFPALNDDGVTTIRDLSRDGFIEFCGTVARSAIEILGGDGRSQLGICGAPSCGMFFLATNSRQTWCSSACGNRARVARHAARSRKRSSLPAAPVQASPVRQAMRRRLDARRGP